MSSTPCRTFLAAPAKISPPTLSLALETITEMRSIRFDAAFIEREMRAHREWQQQEEVRAASEIVREVEAALITRLLEADLAD